MPEFVGVKTGVTTLLDAVYDTPEIPNDPTDEDLIRELFEDDDEPTDEDLASITPEDEAIDTAGFEDISEDDLNQH